MVVDVFIENIKELRRKLDYKYHVAYEEIVGKIRERGFHNEVYRRSFYGPFRDLFNTVKGERKEVEDILGKKTLEFTQDIMLTHYNSISKWNMLRGLLMKSLFIVSIGC